MYDFVCLRLLEAPGSEELCQRAVLGTVCGDCREGSSFWPEEEWCFYCRHLPRVVLCLGLPLLLMVSMIWGCVTRGADEGRRGRG